MVVDAKSFTIHLPVPDSMFAFSEAISTFYKEGELVDAAIMVEGIKLDVHKVIMCAASEYLEELFDKSSDDTIALEGVKYEEVKTVLDFIYTGRLPQDAIFVEKLLPIFSKLKLDSGLELISSIISSSIRPENCVRLMHLSKSYDLTSLYTATYSYGLNNLDLCEKSDPEFKNLSFEEIVDFLKDDKLNISENKVFHATISWLKANESQQTSALTLMKQIRYPSMKKEYLESMRTDSIVTAIPACVEFIQEGLTWHNKSPEEQNAVKNSNTKPRERDSATED